jgi:hypothetical protein
MSVLIAVLFLLFILDWKLEHIITEISCGVIELRRIADALEGKEKP